VFMDSIITFYSQGQAISANLSIPLEGAPCIIMSHGLEGSKDGAKWQLLSNKLYEFGIASLRFNYRGCGNGKDKSQGKFEETTLIGRIQDFRAALDFVKGTAVDRSRLGVVGSSLGGVVAIAAWDKRIKAMVAMATPLQFPKPTEKQLRHTKDAEYFNLPSGRRIKVEFLKELWGHDTGRDVVGVECPLLIIHGSSDEDFPVINARRLYDKANKPKQLEIIRGGSHGFDNPNHLQQIASLALGWFRRYL
jgi:dipeptidyl aminopeptidase/acylaminoacyl peptidase